MALFGKKEPCAICGGKVKALFPSKIDGQFVCKECHGAVDLPDGMEKQMTMNDFLAYRTFREGNLLLKQKFIVTDQIDFGWFDTKFMIDMSNRLLCLDKNLEKTIFEGNQIAWFSIREDAEPLFEGRPNGLYCYNSSVPDRVREMAPRIEQIMMQKRMQRSMERLADRLDGDRDNPPPRHTLYTDIPEPFKQFNVEIHFDHPYWEVIRADMSGPTFDNDYPDINSYLNTYHDNAALIERLARALMALAFPGAPDVDPSAPVGAVQVSSTTITHDAATVAAAQSASVDPVEEIQRYKKLLDQGILTEEEFAAKKRQLLGL